MTERKLTEIQLHDEVARTLREVASAEAGYETTTVGQLVSLRARTHPSEIAIEFFERGEKATYTEMDKLSNKYANALRAFGVRKGDRIGMMLPNRIEFPILWFAIAKLGAVMVPLNVHYTSREIEYVLSDTQAKVAIVDESICSVFSSMEPWPKDLRKDRVIVVGGSSSNGFTDILDLALLCDDSPIEQDVRCDDLAGIQYTSGTTGFPKGCMLTHDYMGVASYSYAHWQREAYKKYLCWVPFSYAFGQWLLLVSYRQGATLYVAQKFSSSRLIGWIRQLGIQWCPFPSFVAQNVKTIPDSLKEVSQYDGWDLATVRRIRDEFGVRAQNCFAMTEIGCGTQVHRDIDDLNSNGLRAPFRELRLVNDDGSPTSVGEVGELWVKGRGIFKGYWNKPEANAESFEGEWFKTGDLMRRDEFGFHWLVGRKKDMIRRSAENIAAREVEAVIRDLPEIVDVAAIPVRDAKRGEEVKICVELRQDLEPGDLLIERILEHARARLAPFKVPRYIAFVQALPRTTSSNKVLKRELMEVANPVAGTYDVEEQRWR